MKRKILSILNVVKWLIFMVLVVFALTFAIGKFKESFQYLDKGCKKGILT